MITTLLGTARLQHGGVLGNSHTRRIRHFSKELVRLVKWKDDSNVVTTRNEFGS